MHPSAGYGKSREEVFTYLLDQANANDYACTLVWHVSAPSEGLLPWLRALDSRRRRCTGPRLPVQGHGDASLSLLLCCRSRTRTWTAWTPSTASPTPSPMARMAQRRWSGRTHS